MSIFISLRKIAIFCKTMKNQERKYLGVDWGRRKVGLAVAEAEVRIAHVLGIVIVQNQGEAVGKIAQIVFDEEITDVVVGLPVSQLHGNEASEVLAFIESLRKLCPQIEIHQTDELFSTVAAKRALAESGKTTRRHNDDAHAAQILLQSWLDAN